MCLSLWYMQFCLEKEFFLRKILRMLINVEKSDKLLISCKSSLFPLRQLFFGKRNTQFLLISLFIWTSQIQKLNNCWQQVLSRLRGLSLSWRNLESSNKICKEISRLWTLTRREIWRITFWKILQDFLVSNNDIYNTKYCIYILICFITNIFLRAKRSIHIL